MMLLLHPAERGRMEIYIAASGWALVGGVFLIVQAVRLWPGPDTAYEAPDPGPASDDA
jgi:hypothetical protein